MSLIFRIDENIQLRLENNRTYLYVGNQLFRQCKRLILGLPKEYVDVFENINSIDDAAEKMGGYLENELRNTRRITPEEEFWGHCSNLHTWVENDYDTRLLHVNLAFPLLRKLSEIGDLKAQKVFKKEIIKRIEEGSATVIAFLSNNEYFNFLDRDEIDQIFENPNFINSLIDILEGISYFLINDILRLLRYIVKEHPSFFKRIFEKVDFTLDTMNYIKIIELGLGLNLTKFFDSEQKKKLNLNSEELKLLRLYSSLDNEEYKDFPQSRLLARILSCLLQDLNNEEGNSSGNLNKYALIRFLKANFPLDDYDDSKLASFIEYSDSIILEFLPLLFKIPGEGIYSSGVLNPHGRYYHLYIDTIIVIISSSNSIIKKMVIQYFTEKIKDYHNLGKLIFILLGFVKKRVHRDGALIICLDFNHFGIDLFKIIVNRLFNDITSNTTLPVDSQGYGLTNLDYMWLFEIPHYFRRNSIISKHPNKKFEMVGQFPKDFFWYLNDDEDFLLIRNRLLLLHEVLNKIKEI